MAEIIEIKKTELDREFRRRVGMLLDSAEKEVAIITGEGAAFGYYDLRLATERAVARGVKVRIYTTNPVPEFLNKVMMLGCKVYRGKEMTKDHFMVADGKNWAVSKAHPPRAIGVRHGQVSLGDRGGAEKVQKEFGRLASKAEEVKEPMWDEDPLVQALRHPKSWGVKTDSRRFREELYR
ncbi:MAG: hypothetical protein AB1476_04845 [Candidatus Hadarchaeota archaeon]